MGNSYHLPHMLVILPSSTLYPAQVPTLFHFLVCNGTRINGYNQPPPSLRHQLSVNSGGLPWWLGWYRICPQCRRPKFDPWFGKIPWRREWLPTSVILPGEFHGQRCLAGYSPWGHKEMDMTEQLTLFRSPTRNQGRAACRVWRRMGPGLRNWSQPLWVPS